ncbi:hypothetical protein AAC387_Pa07g2118 [Persea americana]|eukprot:TRINITY_DN4112_c1_g1_i1.p1 TRINITY_DN4112_c1_g1~~TRINITY_DN4112_c1_g1_i1.p1  ORF type:complete len:396 (-),score=46.80 TRINITY_DN4112_c1_g1_i1:493-1680(-)
MAYFSRFRSLSLRHFSSSSILSPNSTSPLTSKQKSRAALALLKSESNPDRILDICRSASLTPVSHLDRIAFSIAVSKLSRSQSFTAISSYLDDLKSRPDLRNDRFLSHAVVLYGQAGMLDHALRTFREFDDLGVPRSTKSLNALLFACILAKKHDEVNRIFREYPRIYGISPDIETYNTVIKSFCESGQSKSVFAVLDEMGRKGCKPTATSYNTLLAGLYREERYDDVGNVLEMMKEDDCHPAISTYNVRIQSLCKLKKTAEAKALLDGLLSRGPKPNTDTYYHLIYGFCKEGELAEAKRLFGAMSRNGCFPDSNCYFTLSYYLCEGGDFDAALRVCKQSIRKDWVPNFTTMKMLVNGLVSKSKVDEAREILGQIKEKFPSKVDMWKEVEESLPQ